MNSTAQIIAVEAANPSDAETAAILPTIGQRLSRTIFLVSLTIAMGGWIAFLAWLFLKIA